MSVSSSTKRNTHVTAVQFVPVYHSNAALVLQIQTEDWQAIKRCISFPYLIGVFWRLSFPIILTIGYFYHLIGKIVSSWHVTHIVYLLVSTKLQMTAFCLVFSLPQAQFLPFVSSPLLETMNKLFLLQKATSNIYYVTSVQNRSWKPKLSCSHFLLSH